MLLLTQEPSEQALNYDFEERFWYKMCFVQTPYHHKQPSPNNNYGNPPTKLAKKFGHLQKQTVQVTKSKQITKLVTK